MAEVVHQSVYSHVAADHRQNQTGDHTLDRHDTMTASQYHQLMLQ